ncbi:glycosyltransferase family 2 protein [Vibrio splendidus]|uniref:glycosyltransferase family 2 protein n=1 Tax=Vibrio splendidus TaxID=29497 RepID=UPI000769B932|nr:glycosyltransferase family 2 protein [Vibrio splendidus]PHX05714.1 Rhamnosyltransferase WbbL [Vibrio splendidus]
MNVYISVISHGHSELMNRLLCLPALAEKYQVVVKSNKPQDKFDAWISHPNVHWINDGYGYGFGHNNNIAFNHCCSKLGMVEDDCFIILNPDVVIEVCEIERLIFDMQEKQVKLAAINLFKDNEFTNYDNSIRNFPSLIQFSKSFLGLGNSSILDKSSLSAPSQVDWAAGSFLAFQARHYANLGGFDENYFMYCEDIDICYRSYLVGERTMYYPDIKARHLAKHENRKLISKHFYWHVISVIRFLFTKAGLTKAKSDLTLDKLL